MKDHDVRLDLGEESLLLRPTLKAAMLIDEHFGGFARALESVPYFRLADYIVIIAAGLGKETHQVKEAVYRAGVYDLVAPITEFIATLANGGRDPKEKATPSGNE